jgi:hypothetical protein
MPAPFQRLSVADFADLLKVFPFTRTVTSVHLHHTWRPNHAQFRGHDSIVAMWSYHTRERKFADIAQHMTIDPQGFLWTGRGLNVAPASASGHNGNSFSGPFMIELVGDFDRGRDTFAGPQASATWDVIKLLLAHFNLPPEAVIFHNQLAPKSCPGASFDRAAVIQLLRARATPDLTGTGDAEIVSTARRNWEVTAGARAQESLDAELEYVDELQHIYDEDRGARGLDTELTPDELDLLRGHVVNLRMGRFSSEGLMTGSEADVDRIFEECLPGWIQQLSPGARPRLMFFAHGGLVKESKALRAALATRGWWLANGVYPIYFVWETGLFETLGSMLRRGRDQTVPAGERGVIADRITDPLLEEIVRALGGQRIWGAMKASARLASAEGGGARYVARKLVEFLAGVGNNAELHAVGHSAGSIFHGYFVPTCMQLGESQFPGFRTLHLLAPAITCRDFSDLLMPLAGKPGGVYRTTMFTMRKHLERSDNCAAIYRKSLLYLVSEACEDKRKRPLLGLDESIRDDPKIKAFFGLGSNPPAAAEVVWSKSPLEDGCGASRATSHGDFDDDPATMTSVLRRVLDGCDGRPIVPFPKRTGDRDRSAGDDWLSEVDWPEGVTRKSVGLVAAAPTLEGPPGASTFVSSSTGRRIAVCVGIDAYADQPLQGCVNDARRWGATLRSLGFEVTSIENDKATRERIHGLLNDLIERSRAGDTLVFQYAGHGTQLEDLDGDELDGDTPGYDEAIVPYDYQTGAYLIDDDIAALVPKLPADVRLTFLLDCCHSGTGTRFAVGRGLQSRDTVGVKARRMIATPAMMAMHRQYRLNSAVRSLSAGSRSAVAVHTMREVALAACQSHELAYETGGAGDFTQRAHEVIARRSSGLTNAGFYEALLQAFGSSPRQRPRLDCDVTFRAAPLLGIDWK